MIVYKVRIDERAEEDLFDLYKFLKQVMSRYGANKYIDVIMSEIQSLSLYANFYSTTTSPFIKRINLQARRMVSHNKKWDYIFHIEDNIVVVDRILPSKIIIR